MFELEPSPTSRGASRCCGSPATAPHRPLPPLARQWLPHRVGFATAVYTNGLLFGEIFPVALTIPLVLPLVEDSWRLAFVVWAVPALLIGLALATFAPRAAPTAEDVPT